MTDTTTLTALLKAVQTATSLSGLSALLLNSSGELAKTKSSKIVMLHETDTRTLNADDAVEPGIYMVPSNAENVPKSISRGVMIVMVFPSNIYQLLIARFGAIPGLWMRLFSQETTEKGWSAWVRISAETV